MKKIIVALLIMFASSPAFGDTLYLKATAFADPLTGKMVDDPAIVIEDGKITAIGRSENLPIPEGARLIDLSGKTILPGLIDMHVHLTESPTIRGYRALGLSVHTRTIMGVAAAHKTLLGGFTTVRNVSASSYSDVALRDAITGGVIPGPRMFVSGPPVGITGGHCSDNNLLPSEYDDHGENVADGPWAMRKKVRRNIKYGVDLIKTCSTGGVFSKGTTLGAAQGTVDELTAIVEEAHARGMKVASHAHGTVGIKNALRAGVDTIEHASFLDDEAIRMAKRNGAYFSMDIYNTEYTLAEGEKNGVLEESLQKEREVGTIQRESFTKAVKAGAKVIFGTDAAIYPHGDNARQFSRMTRFGMTPVQALRAATTLAAEALGQGDNIGALTPGLYADVIAVEGDPFSDISILEQVDFVMKEGVVYKRDGKVVLH